MKGHELEVAVVDEILGKPAGSRRRTKIIGRDLLQNVSPPVIKHDRPTRSLKPRQRRLIHVPSAFLSTEALARPLNDVVDHAPMLSPTRPCGSALADRSSSRVTALIPTLTPPDGRQYGQPGRC
jgi:hypothetical protein